MVIIIIIIAHRNKQSQVEQYKRQTMSMSSFHKIHMRKNHFYRMFSASFPSISVVYAMDGTSIQPRVSSNSHKSLVIHSNEFQSCRPLIRNKAFLHYIKCRTTVNSLSSSQRLRSSYGHLLFTLRPNDNFVMWKTEWIFFIFWKCVWKIDKTRAYKILLFSYR